MNSMTFTTSEIRAILARRNHPWRERLYRLDVRAARWLSRNSLTLMRVSAAVVLFWLGLAHLMSALSQPTFATVALAALELVAAVSFVINPFRRALPLLLLLQLLGTLLTADAQTLATSLMILSAGLVIAATARGGGLTSEANALEKARHVERKA